jgi:signal transduction histidine kinase/DNA-binding NarL/FixJ family response regulator
MTLLRALIVEDSPEDAELTLGALRRGGYELVWERVETREAMLSALRDREWDVVLSDYHLPAFSALGALATLQESGRDLPFIIASGTIGEDVAVEALKAGADDFVVKGRLARLIPAIERGMRDAEGRRRHREAEGELARSARLLRLVVDSVPDRVAVVDADGRLALRNAADEQLASRASADAVASAWPQQAGLFLSDRTTPCPPDQLPLVRALRGDAVDGAVLFERDERSPQGTWLTVNARPVREGDGRIVGAVAVARDTTRERQAQEQLLQSERMASVGVLAAGLAHEINNPLAAVVANVELCISQIGGLRERIGETEAVEVLASLEDAREASQRMRQILKDLKVFSRGEDERPGSIDVARTLDSAIRMASNEIRHRAELVRLYQAVPPAQGNESRLGQVFLNLLVNAAQAIPEGRAADNEIRASVGAAADGRIMVEIRDTGTGMAPDIVQRLFTPFFTTKPVGVGTGLGLSICHRIVGSMGGEIIVESEVGKGTAFRVLLPATPERTPARPADTLAAPRAAAIRRGRVLVVDDEAALAKSIRRILSRDHDCVVLTAAQDAAAQISGGERYDVILCDLMMPTMTGMDLHEALLRAVPEQAARMIFLTGGAFTERARAFLSSVANARLDKPFDPAELRALVNDHVR